jgi:O-antigen ligase
MIQSRALPPAVNKTIRIAAVILLGVVALGSGAALGTLLASPDYSIVVTAVGVAFCLALVIVDHKLGMLFWIIMYPYARFIPLDISMGHGIPDLKLGRMVTLVLLALWAARVAIRRRKGSRVYWSDIFLVLFTILMLVTYVGGSLPLRTALQNFWDIWLVPLLAYVLARQLFSTERDMSRIGITLSIIGLYLGLLASQEQLTGIILFYPENRSIYYSENIRRVVNLLGNPAYIAACLVMAAPFAARGMIQSHTRGRRLGWLGILVAIALGTFMCYNRAGWLGLVVGLMAMVPFYPKWRKFFVPVLVISGLILLATWGVVGSSPAIQERLQSEGPIQYRLNAYSTLFKMIRAHPIMGVGQGNYSDQYNLYAFGVAYQYFDPNNVRVVAAPHNSILYILVNGGILTLLPYLGFLASSLWLTIRFYRGVRWRLMPVRSLIIATWAAMAAYMVPAMAGDMVEHPFVSILFYLILGGVQGWILGEGQMYLVPEEEVQR